MTITEISSLLDQALADQKAKGLDDDKRLKLELLTLDLRRQIRLGVFNTLKDLDAVTAVDTAQLSLLATNLKAETQNTQRRGEILEKILGVAKAGLRAAGVPIA